MRRCAVRDVDVSLYFGALRCWPQEGGVRLTWRAHVSVERGVELVGSGLGFVQVWHVPRSVTRNDLFVLLRWNVSCVVQCRLVDYSV